MKRDIKSMLSCELLEYFESTGEARYRAEQVFSALHRGVLSFSDMKNLSLALRSKLEDEFYISSLELIEKQVSKTDNTAKYLWRLQDDEAVECVLMEHRHGSTICISTQVGCKMGCRFCASAIGGFKRNLTPSEMLDQLLFTQLDITPLMQGGKRINNVVLMGIGEPLNNFDNVMRFIRIINSQSGIKIGARNITVSTCGIIENIDKMAEYDVQLTLAISLHAPDDETRTYLMPVNREGDVKALLDAGSRYFAKTGRRVTYEYAIIAGVNDSNEQAAKLSELLRGTQCHVNLITPNNIENSEFKPGSGKDIYRFKNILTKNGINCTIRRSLGTDIEAACGQLRRRKLQEVD
ncbi:MAG: 23S rRNA (adenine(2503)-C(2))-methyltransferase RlmN [Oscillospiraceae bacterium]|nr:23S rRNA (adenine(2503)-C(2))-methyltransferase RlmN [Oscillospiraceae bacterium]